MPYFIVFLMLLGALVGYAANYLMSLRIAPLNAALAGAFGGVLGGIGLRFLLGPFGAMAGALLGAAILVAAIQLLSAPRS